MVLHDEICRFLVENGVEYRTGQTGGIDMIYVGHSAAILPVDISAESVEEARSQAESVRNAVNALRKENGEYPYIITEDRWRTQQPATGQRLLAHLQIFTQLYARNCEVRKIDRKTAEDFLTENHSYGDASCRYRYGLFLKRHTGHNAASADVQPGTLVAVATFSNARKWIKGDKTIRSYEWTRYASLPYVRLSGGMGKILKAFIEEICPDDIMTYADLEWSEGKVYEQLGFVLEGFKEPVTFVIDRDSRRRSPIRSGRTGREPGRRSPVKSGMTGRESGRTGDVIPGLTGNLFFMNLGSNKYRMKLTDYQ